MRAARWATSATLMTQSPRPALAAASPTPSPRPSLSTTWCAGPPSTASVAQTSTSSGNNSMAVLRNASIFLILTDQTSPIPVHNRGQSATLSASEYSDEQMNGSNKEEAQNRFWDVDLVRGVAIVMVAFYHLIYDLDNFAGYPIESTSGFWDVFADTSAFMFVFLVGLSLSISHARVDATVPGRVLFGKYLRRGMRIFGYGLLITAVFLVLGYGYVIFGILHLIGLSIVLAYPFLKLRYINLLLGLSLIAAGGYVQAQDLVVGEAAGVLLAPLGVSPEGLFMPDYRPLLPWFGVVLLGVFFGNAAYLSWRKNSPPSPTPQIAAPLAFLGCHTLFIYLIHQPVLIAILWMLGMISPGF